MIRSMTGYGAATADQDGHAITIEVRSVNSKQREVRVRLPSVLGALEPKLREQTQQRTHRGRIDVSVTWERDPTLSGDYTLNVGAVRGVLDAWKTLVSEFDMPDQSPNPDQLLRLPGVLEVSPAKIEAGQLAELSQRVLEEALDQYTAAREKEGERLRRDLVVRVQEIRSRVEGIETRLEGGAERQAQLLRQRIEPLLQEVPLDEARLAQEVAILAQKADVTEELVRLRAHLKRLDTLVEPDAVEVGRTLEFLVQEVRREVTTLGVKGADTEVDAHVLAIKAELEKLREQAANLE